jgi:hypothetical protein
MKLAAGSIDGSIYTSADGGATWTQRTGAGNWYWQSIASSADGMALAAVGNNPGYVYTSTDGGATWTQRTGAGSRNWRSIASSADGTKLAAVAGGNTLYTSADGGATWTTQTAPTTSGLMGVWFLTVASSADGNKLVVGSGVLYGSIWTVDLGYTPPASCTVTLTPNPVNQGASSTLSWSASNADTSVYIENVGYMSGSSGSFSVTRSATTDYSCYASGAGGSDGWHEATLTVLRSCAWDGGSVTNGESVTAYQASTVPYGSSCVSQTRTCSDGTLSGTYAYASCEVSHQACTQDGATIEHGESHTFYLSQVGAPCSSVSQSRTCTDGTLSGSPSYQYASCTCAPLYSCSGSDITYTDASCTTTTVRSCTAPYFCSPGSSSCISPEPVFNAGNGRTGHLQVQPQLVPKGLTTTVYWDVANVQSCTVTGDNGDSWTGLTGAKTSSPISSQTRYTLSCTPLEGASFPTETQQVNVVPVFLEV